MVAARSSFVCLNGGGFDPRFVDLVETRWEMWKNGDRKLLPPLLHLS